MTTQTKTANAANIGGLLKQSRFGNGRRANLSTTQPTPTTGKNTPAHCSIHLKKIPAVPTGKYAGKRKITEGKIPRSLVKISEKNRTQRSA